MARTTLLVLLAASLVTVTMFQTSQADSYEFDIAPDSDMSPDSYDSDIIYSPEPSPDPAAATCASKITLDCATEIMINDFFQTHVEAKCCRQLLRMGKRCNDLLVDDVLAVFDIKSRKAKMHNRSDHLWNKCLQVSLTLKSKP